MSSKKQTLQQTIDAKQRQLLAKWTISPSVTDMPLQIHEELADILQEEINAQHIIEALKKLGWYSFDRPEHERWDIDTLTEWCSSNCIGKYRLFYHTCLFEDKEDATKFNLVWG